MRILLSNSSGVPLYDQIKEQVRDQILCGELVEGALLPSLRSLARELRISVLTTTRAYNELEQEGYILSSPGRGFFVSPRDSALMQEQLLRDVEETLSQSLVAARRAGLNFEELVAMLRLLDSVDGERDDRLAQDDPQGGY